LSFGDASVVPGRMNDGDERVGFIIGGGCIQNGEKNESLEDGNLNKEACLAVLPLKPSPLSVCPT
jgi:hypothetical protein